MLTPNDRPLVDVHDVALLDLDGVVYIGGAAVPGVVGHLASAEAAGLRLAYVTNNASRTPDDVARHLGELGVPAAPDDVVTSAQAAAGLLCAEHGRGARIVALGGDGLVQALREARLDPVGADEQAVAVATGYGPDVRWREVMRVAVRVREGLPWVASNTDHTIPTPYGVAPGHGVLVETIARFAGVDPTVAGKPQAPLLAETVHRTGARAPLMVGDRLDTDIEGAANAGMDSLLVLTGVTGLAELVAARPGERPTYLAPDLGALLRPQPAPAPGADGVTLGGWSGSVREGRLVVHGCGTPEDWWRVVAVTAWDHRDREGAPLDIRDLAVPATEDGER